MTANLQRGVKVREAARQMNISERSVYSARRIISSGRTDLIEACEQGRMSFNAALLAIDGPRKRDGVAALARAWNVATEDERNSFLNRLIGQ